jgi:hypothetical protein
MTVGTEHEYSINDRSFHPLPVADLLIEELSGSIQNEFTYGGIEISKELQKHVIEVKPARPSSSLRELETGLYGGLQSLYAASGDKYRFLGLGMHPLLTLDQTTYWDHEEKEIFDTYHRLFNLRQHGWLNIQALQVNIPYENDEHLISMFNRIRALIPYLIAVTASSPFVEGKMTASLDNRAVYYRMNQQQIPLICHGIIPEKLRSVGDYTSIQEEICRQLERADAAILCKEWVNSRGVIVRFSRRCLEIKAIDEQECIHSDMAVTAFILSLLRSAQLDLEDDEQALRDLTETAVRYGTEKLSSELEALYRKAWESATQEERTYLPLIQKRIAEGSVAEIFARRMRETGDLQGIIASAEESLRMNRPIVDGRL